MGARINVRPGCRGSTEDGISVSPWDGVYDSGYVNKIYKIRDGNQKLSVYIKRKKNRSL